MIRPELCSTPVYRIEEEKENVKKLIFRFQSISVFFWWEFLLGEGRSS
jgi:hypothetical protein